MDAEGLLGPVFEITSFPVQSAIRYSTLSTIGPVGKGGEDSKHLALPSRLLIVARGNLTIADVGNRPGAEIEVSSGPVRFGRSFHFGKTSSWRRVPHQRDRWLSTLRSSGLPPHAHARRIPVRKLYASVLERLLNYSYGCRVGPGYALLKPDDRSLTNASMPRKVPHAPVQSRPSHFTLCGIDSHAHRLNGFLHPRKCAPCS